MSETSMEFIMLATSLSTAAMAALGKLMNPVTQKVEKNLEEAKRSIDMLAMLEKKTRGNLNQEEEKYLSEILTQLRANYVQVAAEAPPSVPDTANENKDEPEQSEEKPEEKREEKEEG